MRQHPERNLHRAVAQYLNWALPADAYWFPVPSASRRIASQAANMKRAGELKVGVPDIFIIYRGRAIAVELKAPKGRVVTSQKNAHDELTLAGAAVTVARSVDDVSGFLTNIIPNLKVKL